MTWEQSKLGCHFDIKHGFAFKGEYFGESGQYVVVTPGNFFEEGGFRTKGEKEKFYTIDPPTDYILAEGDLIIAMTEQGEGLLGSSAIIPVDNYYLHNQRIGLITSLNEASLDKKFLYYLFNTHEVRAQIRASATGLKVRHTAPQRVKDVNVPLPPLDTQRRIADILSAYDDLIANNSRRMALLEESMHLLYREWFVHHRFPGHEHTPIVNGVPAGWEKIKLGAICDVITRGISPVYDDESSNIVLNQRCIRDFTIDFTNARNHTSNVPDQKYVRFGDMLVNSTGIGTLGRLAQVRSEYENLTVDTHITIVRPQEHLEVHFFGLAMEHLQPHIESLGQGATGQTELKRTLLMDVQILLPDPAIRQEFDQVAQPYRILTQRLMEQNQRLRAARDLLLTRLMNGAIPL